jgi:hypothetical protein
VYSVQLYSALLKIHPATPAPPGALLDSWLAGCLPSHRRPVCWLAVHLLLTALAAHRVAAFDTFVVAVPSRLIWPPYGLNLARLASAAAPCRCAGRRPEATRARR